MFEEVKIKREQYEKKITDMMNEFEEWLPSDIKLDSVIVIRSLDSDFVKQGKLRCTIKLIVENL